jgi:phosphate transport system permease protein
MTALEDRSATRTPPPAAPPDRPEARRATRASAGTDRIVLAGALAAGLSLAIVLSTQILTDPGPVGFTVLAYGCFLLSYAVLVGIGDNGLAVRDKLAEVVITGLAVLALSALVYVAGYTLARGRDALSNLNFFYQDMSNAGSLEPLDVGGIAHAAYGTLVEITIALAITIPLGITTAVFLNETRGPFPRFVRTISEAMTALPSIIAGLFILAAVILGLGLDKSGFAAGLAISVMMLPIIIRASDVQLRLVPGSLREASLAMGAGQWRTVWHVVLPTARSGLTTAVLLGAARGMGETSPVLLTAGFGSVFNPDPTSGPMVSLPLAAFVFSGSPQPTMIARGFGAAAALLMLVFVLFALARVFGGKPAGELSARGLRHRAAQSAQDAARFAARVPRPAEPEVPHHAR